MSKQEAQDSQLRRLGDTLRSYESTLVLLHLRGRSPTKCQRQHVRYGGIGWSSRVFNRQTQTAQAPSKYADCALGPVYLPILSFLESLDRILTPKYQPTMSDVIRAPERLQTVRETRLAIENLNADLIEVPHGRLARVIHQFDHVDACLLSLDLTSYDRYSEDDKVRNTLEQGLSLFKGICRSFDTKPIMLVCVNFSAFRKKLKISPLSIHFPDFKGGSDPSAAATFILRQCKRMLCGNQDLYHHFAEDDATDPSTIRFLERKIAGLPGREYMIRMLGLQSSSAIRASEQPRTRAGTKKSLAPRSQSAVSV